MATKVSLFSEGLPAELQIEIIRYCLPNQHHITALNHSQRFAHRVLKLSLVSKHLRSLVELSYYGDNTFIIARSRTSGSSPNIIRIPSTAVLRHIRRVYLHIQLVGDVKHLADMFMHEGTHNHERGPGDLLTLLHPHEAWELDDRLKIPIGDASVSEVTYMSLNDYHYIYLTSGGRATTGVQLISSPEIALHVGRSTSPIWRGSLSLSNGSIGWIHKLVER
jgi:hypothetical protein